VAIDHLIAAVSLRAFLLLAATGIVYRVGVHLGFLSLARVL